MTYARKYATNAADGQNARMEAVVASAACVALVACVACVALDGWQSRLTQCLCLIDNICTKIVPLEKGDYPLQFTELTLFR